MMWLVAVLMLLPALSWGQPTYPFGTLPPCPASFTVLPARHLCVDATNTAYIGTGTSYTVIGSVDAGTSIVDSTDCDEITSGFCREVDAQGAYLRTFLGDGAAPPVCIADCALTTGDLQDVCGANCTYDGADDPNTAFRVGNTGGTERLELYIDSTTGGRIRFNNSGTYKTWDRRYEVGDDYDEYLSGGAVCRTVDSETGLETIASTSSCEGTTGSRYYSARIGVGGSSSSAAACISASSDRLYHDTNCNGTKDGGEEFIDQVGSTQTWDIYYGCSNHTTDNSTFMVLNTGQCAGSETAQPSTVSVVNFTGTITSIRCRTQTAFGAGTTMTYTVRHNLTTNTDVTCAISGATDTTCTDTGSQAVSPGDRITLDNTETGTDNTAGANMQCTVSGTKS